MRAPVPRFYGSLEYLCWWLKPAPLSVPLVSTGPISTTHHGWLDNSDAIILYGAPYYPAQGGNDSQSFPLTSGGRLTLGYWFDEDKRFAVEIGGFGLQNQSAGYEIWSDGTGSPVINIPVFNTVPYAPGGRPPQPAYQEDGLPASLPSDPTRFDGNKGIITGGVKIDNTIQLWGANLQGVINLRRDDSWEVSGLAGVRYLELTEKFHLHYESTGVSDFYAGQFGTADDYFDTQNQFYGGTLGLRVRNTSGPWSTEISALLSPGWSHEVENVSGAYIQTYNGMVTRSGPESVFAQPANEGRTTSDKFSVVPELQFKIGYALSSCLRATLGYDFLYYSNVIRPGDQIDRGIPKGQTFQQGGFTVSTTSPERFFKTTDFYAHGLTFGLELTF